jgi:serine protease Do
MNLKRLQAIGIVLGVALFVATGLLVWTGAERAPSSKGHFLPAVAPASTASLRQLSDTFADVAGRIKPCVVSVHSEKIVKVPRFEWPFGDDSPFRYFFWDDRRDRERGPRLREWQFRQPGLGSGIIIDRNGHILTNYHVVRDVDEIRVTLADKRSFAAVVVGTDPQTDLAVIKIKDKVPADLPVAELGDSDALRVGDWVLAVGAPFGYGHTVTAGIVSAKGRSVAGSDNYQDFIQTDAAINPGNSGGPLVDLEGKVVGINSAIITSVGQYSGVGFAIPVNMAAAIYPTLIKGGKVARGLLGVIIQPVDDEMSRQFELPDTRGALVSQVNKDSAAEKAGIKPGDVIIRYNGQIVEDSRHLRNLVGATAPGTKVKIVVWRGGKEHNFEAQVGELAAGKASAGEPEESSATDLGLKVEPLTADKAKELGYEKGEGVLVAEVEDDSPAASADLQPGDLIKSVNHQEVTTVTEFRDALAKAKSKESVLMLVKHKNASRFVIVKTK